MAENHTWGDAERIVCRVLSERDPEVSLERRICDALRAAGLLKPQTYKATPVDRARVQQMIHTEAQLLAHAFEPFAK